MTVSSTNTKVSLNGNGSTTAFAYNFKVFADADLQVIVRSAAGVETTKSSGTHYNASGIGSDSGGTVTFTSGNVPASGQTVIIIRNKTIAQSLNLVANDPFPAESLEASLDKITHLILQNNEELDRALKISKTNTMTSTEFTTSAADRANKVLSFNASGELAVTQELGVVKGNWAASTAYVVRDIVKDTSTNNIFIAIVAHSSSGSQPLTTNTDSAKWSLLVDAATATTSATTATNKAADASKLAITVEDSQYTLSDGSTTGFSALHFSAKATASASGAATSATNAASSLATFQAQYYGALSSAPTSNLATGDLYFHTGQGIKVYNGSAFEDVKPTSAEQTAINALSASAVVADMAILASDAIVSDLAILGSNAIVSDMEILATTDNVTAMGRLGVASVVEDMGLLGTSAVISDMAALAGSGGSPSITSVTTSGNVVIGGLLKMPDVTSGKILVGDGTSYQEVAVSGDVTIASSGAVTIGAGAVENSMLADDAVGADELAANAVVNASIASGAAIVDTKLAAISTANKVALTALDIDGGTDIGEAIVDADLFIVDNGAGGTNRKVAASRMKTYISAGDIAGVTAGTGLSGGGTSGTVTLNVDASQTQITSVGNLNAGSITSGFTSIDVGAGAIATTGEVSAGVLSSTGGLAAAGGAVFNEAGADVDFRVESENNANMLFVDGENDTINIGSADQGAVRLGQVLNLVQTGNFGGMSLTSYSTDNNERCLLDFNKSGQATIGSHGVVADGEDLGSVIFRGDDGDEFLDGAIIQANVDGTPGNGDMPTRLEFMTTANGASTCTERMRITSAGNVAIGNSDPEAFGSLIDNLVVGTVSGNNGITIASGTDSGGRLCFADNTSSPQRGMIEYSHASDSMLFNANGSTRLKISSEGYVTQTNLPFLLGRGNDNTATRTLANNNLFFNTAQGSQVAMSITGSSSVTGGGSHGITYASGNGKFTVPVAGKYFIEGRLRYASATDAAVSVAINTNGNNALAYVILQCTEATTLVVSGVANLAANDFITFSNISGGDRVFFNADAHSGVSIFLIG